MKIGLCLTVRDDAPVVLRCLRSARPAIDFALVVDAGSTDDAPGIVSRFLAREGLPGRVVAEPGRDAGADRSFALAALRRHPDIDYVLVMDPDDVLVLEEGVAPAAWKPGLTAQFYHVEVRRGATRSWSPQLLSNRVEFIYRGVLHEILAARPGQSSAGTATGFRIDKLEDGWRSRRPDGDAEDARILEAALQEEGDAFLRARYTFHLAEHLRQAGELERALETYLERARLGLWDQEVALALRRAAQLKEALGHPDTEVVGSYLRAYEAAPARAEALHGAMAFCRVKGLPHQGYLIGRTALAIPEPTGVPQVEPWIYQFGLLEEFSVAAYLAGHHKDSLRALERLLADHKIPESARPRLTRNAQIVARGLAGAAGLEMPAPPPG